MIRLLLILLILPIATWAQTQVPESQAEISLGFVPVVEKTAPAVVNIYARWTAGGHEGPMQNDPVMKQQMAEDAEAAPKIENSLGSGVILTSDGIVVSNYHVVQMATDIRVVLNDRREYSARILLADQESDLAILKIEGAKGLSALPLRESDTVQVGELVLAIGNPFGIGQTVTSGIVSGLARSGIATGNARGYFIQTDAPINPGNSGGALVDMQGRLIGINTSILSKSGGSNGIGFAIPAALVAEFLVQVEKGHDQYQRPWAGLLGRSVSAEMAVELGLDRPGGIMISLVHPQSAFAFAGFLPGDVITSVNWRVVNTPAEMVYRMSVAGLGKTALVTRMRNGVGAVIELDMISAPNVPNRNQVVTPQNTPIPGMVLSTVNPIVQIEYDLAITASGVVMDDPGDFGREVGLRPGDYLREINDQQITDTAMVISLLENIQDRLFIKLQRGNQHLGLKFSR